MKKAAIKNPYLDTLGGGERYIVGVARVLVEMGYTVEFEWDKMDIIPKLEKRFGLKLSNITTNTNINRGESYDICVWVSDGSIPLLKAKTNILHFQVPFKDVNGSSLINRAKLFRVNHIICNSEFTKNVIDKEFKVNSKVLYPPVDVDKIKSGRKEDIILYVGRFSRLLQSKRQDILVDVFKKNYTKHFKGWKLVLIGGSEIGGKKYIEELKEESKGYPIEILESPPYKTVLNYYKKSKIFWSASGHGIDDQKEPKFVEHFGITTVESMAAGLVPIIYNVGGHKEIIQNNKNGFLWNTPEELIAHTIKIIKSPKLMKQIKKQAKQDSEKYSYENFKKSFKKITEN